MIEVDMLMKQANLPSATCLISLEEIGKSAGSPSGSAGTLIVLARLRTG